MSLDEYLFIVRNVLCLWFEWDWYGVIVIVRLWNMFKYMIVYVVIVSLYARLKSNFVNLYILLFIGICIMFDNNFIVKYKDVKILKNFL